MASTCPHSTVLSVQIGKLWEVRYNGDWTSSFITIYYKNKSSCSLRSVPIRNKVALGTLWVLKFRHQMNGLNASFASCCATYFLFTVSLNSYNKSKGQTLSTDFADENNGAQRNVNFPLWQSWIWAQPVILRLCFLVFISYLQMNYTLPETYL